MTEQQRRARVELDKAAVDEAIVRAHAWAVSMWNERKISADFTSADENELAVMMIGYLRDYLEGNNGAQP